MQPKQPLTIYEVRAVTNAALAVFDQPGNLGRLGATLAGLHWEADFAFIFFAGEAEPVALEFISAHPDLELKHTHHLTYDQWQDGAGAEPFSVAGLTITGPDNFGAIEPKIVIDPGLAFGFGGHPTTKCCLEFLARATGLRSGTPPTALDLGAGTGVLSLAAARWGVEDVTGVDYSHLAVEAALNNLALNGLEKQVKFFRGPAQQYVHHPADLLLANLHLSLQEELFQLGAFQNRQQIIISGLLPSEGDRLWDQLRTLDLKMVDQVRTDRWITMYLAQPGV